MGQLDLFGFDPQAEASSKKKARKGLETKEKKGEDQNTPNVKEDETACSPLFAEETHQVEETPIAPPLAETEEEVSLIISSVTETDHDDTTRQIPEENGTDRLIVFETSIEDVGPGDGAVIDLTASEEPVQVTLAAAEEIASANESVIAVEAAVLQNAADTTFEDRMVFTDGKIGVKFKVKKLNEIKTEPLQEVKDKVAPVAGAVQKRGRKSFREMDLQVDLVDVPDDEILFQKQYYPISTVARWFNVNASLLRFWENEFEILKPRKNRKGDRLFRPEDVKNLKLIYHLLREKKYTIDGARDFLKANKKKADTQLQLTQTLQKFKSFLLELKANL